MPVLTSPKLATTIMLAFIATNCRNPTEPSLESRRTSSQITDSTETEETALAVEDPQKEEKPAALVFENRLLGELLASKASPEFKNFAKSNLQAGRKHLNLSAEEYVASAKRCSRVLSHAEGPDIGIVGETIRRIVEDFSDLIIQGIGALCLHRINQARVSKNGAIASARELVTDGLTQSIAKIAPEDTAHDELMAELAQALPEADFELPTGLTTRVEAILGECEQGTYRASMRGDPLVCKPWTECPKGEVEIEPPTSTSDRVCSEFTACDPLIEYEIAPATPDQNRVCGSLTFCDPMTQFESVAPSSTSDRQCQTLTVCSETQVESVPATEKSDRQCSDL